MSEIGDNRVARRTFLALLAFVGGLALWARTLGRAPGKLIAQRRDRGRTVVRAKAPSREVRALMGDLQPGARVGEATVVAVHDVHFGAIPVVLRLDDGYQFQVDVLARGAQPGIAATSTLALQLANRADGTAPTHEAAGLATMELGRRLAAREAAGARAPRLLTHDGRVLRYPLGRFAV